MKKLAAFRDSALDGIAELNDNMFAAEKEREVDLEERYRDEINQKAMEMIVEVEEEEEQPEVAVV